MRYTRTPPLDLLQAKAKDSEALLKVALKMGYLNLTNITAD